jgi:hypothetical protein
MTASIAGEPGYRGGCGIMAHGCQGAGGTVSIISIGLPTDVAIAGLAGATAFIKVVLTRRKYRLVLDSQQDVPFEAESRCGWLPGQAAVRSMPSVAVKPPRQRVDRLSGGAKGTGVRSFA